MKLSDFKLTAGDFGTFGRGLQVPECVWVGRDAIWASDARGGIAQVREGTDPKLLGSGMTQPNGFSRRSDGSFVVADIGGGRLYAIAPDGKSRILLDSFDGKPLGAVNYACADGLDRIWLSVMTRKPHWHDALTLAEPDGYILRVDGDGTRCELVADGLHLTNEVKLSPDGEYLYAAETLGCRIVRFRILANGSLGPKELVGPESLGRSALPDGITFDAAGNLWVTIINQNALLAIDRQGDVHTIYSDSNAEAVEAMAVATETRTGTVDQLLACAPERGPLRLPTSIAFGGADGRTAYVGTLLLPHLATLRLPEGLG